MQNDTHSMFTFQEVYGSVGLVHVDAHEDTEDHMNGCPIAHGTPFRRAVEEELIDPKRVWQIGIRGSGGDVDDLEWGINKVGRTKLSWFNLRASCNKRQGKTLGKTKAPNPLGIPNHYHGRNSVQRQDVRV